MKASSQLAAADWLRLSWDEVHGIMERAVKRGLERRKRERAIDRLQLLISRGRGRLIRLLVPL